VTLPDTWLIRAGTLLPTRKFQTTARVYSLAALDSCGPSAEDLVAKNIVYTFSYYRRLLKLRRRAYRQRLYRSMEFVGLDSMRVAAKQGRGVVLASIHLGDFDAAGGWLAEVLGLVPVVPAAHLASRAKQRFFHRARASSGVVIRNQASTCLPELAANLSRGRLVLVMLDRRSAGRTTEVRFLGRSALVPTTPWDLAFRTNAMLVPGATWRRADGTSVLWCGNPITVDKAAEGSQRTLQQLADELSHAVRHAPHQWHIPAAISDLPWTQLA
jgi:phosphatidylinositol dimannoside acyltransferase